MLEATTYFGIDNLPAQYSQLFDEAARSSVFLSLAWFRNLEKTVLAADEVVRLIGISKSEAGSPAVGALALRTIKHPNRFRSCFTIDALSSYYTSYFAPIIAPGEDIGEITRLFARALKVSTPRWDILNIRPVDLSEPIVDALCRALNEMALRTQTYFCFGNWYLNVAARSYAEYFRDLPSVIRKNVPYSKRRLEKSSRVRIRLYTNLDDLECGIHDYESIYNASWRGAEAYPAFVRGLVHIAAAQGWLRLGLFYINDEPAAAQIWLIHGGVASIYKVCYAEKFAKSSVGSVLTAHMLEHALDVDRVEEVDYLSGDDSYKAQWMSDRRERWGIMAFNQGTVWGNLGIARHIGGKALKSKSKSLISDITSVEWLGGRAKE